MRLVLLGCPGAGKGTQAHYICEKFQICQISASEVLREAFLRGELTLAAKQAMDAGEFVPDEVITRLVKRRVLRADCNPGYLFDGFPRTIPQAQALIDADIELDYVVEIFVTDEEVVRRLSGRRVHLSSGRTYHVEFNPPKVAGRDDITGEALVHRQDDQAETVRKRLQIYHQRTEPLRKFYRNLATTDLRHPIFLSIDGNGSVEEVRERIFMAL